MKSILIIIAVAIATATTALANVDYQCVNDCTRRGYMYSLCKEKCSYGGYERKEIERPKRTDHACVQDCTKRGITGTFARKGARIKSHLTIVPDSAIFGA